MTIAPQLTAYQLKRAHTMRDQGQGWPKLAMYFGIGIEQLRRQMDPDWQAKRNAGWMAARKQRRRLTGPEKGIRARITERAPDHVLAERERCLACEETPNMAILGDPAPMRSALYRREFVPPDVSRPPFGGPE